jgi:hypothetical protein
MSAPRSTYRYADLYLFSAKVDDAASSGTSGLEWFKIASDGLSGTDWASDRLIASGGWYNFTFPSCIASGNYLLRVELIGTFYSSYLVICTSHNEPFVYVALHQALKPGGAQFFVGPFWLALVHRADDSVYCVDVMRTNQCGWRGIVHSKQHRQLSRSVH